MSARDLTSDPTQTGSSSPSNGFHVTVSQDTTSYTWTITLSAGATYYWEVLQSFPTRRSSDLWSSQNSFTTQAAVTRLAAPALSSPGNGATGVSNQPAFSWTQEPTNQV